jgi:hypothetical protein
MQGARVAHAVTRWMLLALALVGAASQLYGAASCAWAAGGSPTSIPAWWLHRAEAHLCYAGVSLTVGVAAFLALRAWRFTRASLLLAAVAVVLFATPHLREFWAVDICLDRGGRWNASAFACEKQRR